MFKSQNFCHIASNNRNQVKVGVFVYRTTDDLATVLTSGYFNDRIIDINLHDLIIHEKIDTADATKVQRNLHGCKFFSGIFSWGIKNSRERSEQT